MKVDVLREKNFSKISTKETRAILQKIATIEINMKRIESMLEDIEKALIYVAEK